MKVLLGLIMILRLSFFYDEEPLVVQKLTYYSIQQCHDLLWFNFAIEISADIVKNAGN